MSSTWIITHTDLDGVSSVAIILRVLGVAPDEARILFAEPYNLHNVLKGVVDGIDKDDLLVICDLGLNKDTYESIKPMLEALTKRGVLVEWYDHHVWDEEWVEGIRGAGVKLVIDRSTCAAGVVYKYAPKIHDTLPPSDLEELVKATCAADLWTWDHPLAPKLFRAVGRGEEEHGEAWKRKVIDKFYKGVLWDSDLEKSVENYVNAELKGYQKLLRQLLVVRANDTIIAITLKPRGPPGSSIAAAFLASRTRAHIIGVLRNDGGLSLRSSKCDVRIIAYNLGGGGHPQASGAKISFPLYVRIIGFFYKRYLLKYTASRLLRVVEAVGCRPLNERTSSSWH